MRHPCEIDTLWRRDTRTIAALQAYAPFFYLSEEPLRAAFAAIGNISRFVHPTHVSRPSRLSSFLCLSPAHVRVADLLDGSLPARPQTFPSAFLRALPAGSNLSDARRTARFIYLAWSALRLPAAARTGWEEFAIRDESLRREFVAWKTSRGIP